jgi:hypothetical protein
MMSEDRTILEKNIEMWERLTGSYMDSMFKAMQKTMEQSTTFREKIDEAVSSAVGTQMEAIEKAMEQSESFRKQVDEAVSSAVNTQIEATLGAIKAMERQLAALTEKVDELLKKE